MTLSITTWWTIRQQCFVEVSNDSNFEIVEPKNSARFNVTLWNHSRLFSKFRFIQRILYSIDM